MTIISDACPTIGHLGAAFYFIPETVEVGKREGLDGFRFYFLGRGGVLGDVEPDVITSAFGYFHPDLVTRIWTSARERTSLSPRDAGRLYLDCCRDFGRRNFSELSGLAEFCAAGEAVVAAADRAGLALFAGLAAEPLAEDLPGRAMQLVTVLREFRGSAHLLAIVVSGLEPSIAHGIRRPDFWQAFGYPEAELPAGTPEERELLAAADAMTDTLVAPAYSVLDEAGGQALLAGLRGMKQAIKGTPAAALLSQAGPSARAGNATR